MSDSWGNLERVDQAVHGLQFRSEPMPAKNPMLPVGKRRSYGDVCTNEGGLLLDATGLSRFISFDSTRGYLRCEAGVTLWEVLSVIVPRGWFLPVTPGTSFVTVGGAVANDVHGKNHHIAGSFGCFVRSFELRRSDGQLLLCDRQTNPEYFKATIGGLGLTGLITWVEFSLKPVVNADLLVESIEFGNYHEFLELSRTAGKSHEYHVSWVDCFSRSGRGVFFKANHLSEPADASRAPVRASRRVPAFVGHGWSLVNGLSSRLVSRVYFHRHRGFQSYSEPFEKYFYPLDSLLDWNRIYGRRGFFQFQCVVPYESSDAVVEILNAISKSGQGSFLTVLKTMGPKQSPGMLAFSRPGVTLAVDFPNKGARTRQLLHNLETIVRAAQGAIYPAKDALMDRASFRSGYPELETFANYVDPSFSSGFWRRVYDDTP